MTTSDIVSTGTEFTAGSGNAALGSMIFGLAGDNLLVMWRVRIDGDSGYVGRIYQSDGTPVTDEFGIETTTTGNQLAGNVVPLENGGFIVLFASADGEGADTSSYGIRGRVFGADGTAAGDDFVINTSTNGSQTTPNGALLEDGRILLVWSSQDGEGNDSDQGIRAVFLNADGTIPTDASDFEVNTITESGQASPSVAALTGGGYVIAWVSSDQVGSDTDSSLIRATQYASDGTVVGSADFEVNTSGDGNQNAVKVAALADGGYVVVWHSSVDADDGSDNAIRARIFGADGTPAGDDFLVNTTVAGDQLFPTVSVLEDGRIFIAWQSSDEAPPAVRGRLFEADGTPVGDDFVINATEGTSVSYPTVAILSDGDIGVTWVSAIDDVPTVLVTTLEVDETDGDIQWVEGTDEADDLTGTSDADFIRGRKGKDTITGLQGDDTLEGGNGADALYGNLGADTLDGGNGDDTLRGHKGNDTLIGGKGDDDIRGGEGDDTAVYAGNYADYTVTDNEDGTWTVIDDRSTDDNEGTDTLTDVEYLQFADQTVATADIGSGSETELSIHVATGEPGWITGESWALDGARGTLVVDIDGDGDLDIVAAGYQADQFAWYENEGGSFGAATPIVIDAAQNGATGLAAGNLNGDEYVDIVGVSYLEDEVVFYANDGAGNFTKTVVADLDGARGTALADLDGDGHLDIVATGYVADTVVWYRNAGDGTFGTEQVLGAADGANRVVAADLDDDGDLDLLVTAYNGDEVQYYENLGGGTFAAGTVVDSLNGASGLAVGDLDGDGDLDVVVGATNEDKVVWYENTGDGSLAAAVTIASTDGPEGVSLTDLDGDGDLDVLIASDNDDNVLAVENLGGGSFAAAETLLDVNGPWQAIVGEFGGLQTIVTSGYDADEVVLTQRALGTISLAPGEASAIIGLSFSGGASTDMVVVSIEITAGVLSATSGDGVTVDGDGTTLLTLSGTIAEINAFIAAGDVTANVPFNEAAHLKVGVDETADDGSAAALVMLYFGTAPTGIALSSDSISENVANGTVVGTLSAIDPDGDELSYELVDDAGGLFVLVTEDGTTSLVVNGELDYETAISHDVVIKVTDGRYETNETLTVKVADVGEDGAPIDLALSNTTMSESARTGSTVGTLSATDPEGGPITWTLVNGAGDNGAFALKTSDDGTVSVVLGGTLDHESSGGVYDLVVMATDQDGKSTYATIAITVNDDPFKLSSVPTGKDYTAIMESAPVGTQIGYVIQFDASFVPETVELTDDAGGLFSITSGEVSGTAYSFLTVNGSLDHETADLHAVTIKATDANGVSYEKTFQVHVLDAPEATDEGLEARGVITIDANTALADTNGGVDWDTYLDTWFAKIVPGLPGFLPNGSGWSPDNPSDEFIYLNTSDGTAISLKGSDLVYNWSDPISGEDAHVVSGEVTEIAFGNASTTEDTSYPYVLDDPEVTISGLDLANDSSLLNRIWGEAQIAAQAWMYGLNGNSPGDIEFVKAMLASYAQNFIGSDAADTYTGTLFDDTITGNGGDDDLDGGDGDDTAIYSGNYADYTVTDNGNGTWTIADNRSTDDNEGTDTLTDVEYLQFADQTVELTEGVGPSIEIASAGPDFLPSVAVEDAPRGIVPIKSLDVDGDGDVDLVGRTSLGDAGIYWLENDGSGGFSLGGQVTAARPFRFEVGDIDGDGRIDVVGGDYETGTTQWYRNNGDGTFAEAQTIADGTSNTLVIGDVNGDGRTDVLMVPTGQDTVVLQTQNEDGSFAATTIDADFTDAIGLAIGDVDNDGDTDIVASGGSSTELRVYTAGTDGSFSHTHTVDLAGALGLTHSVETLKLAYVDGDEFLDVVALNANQESIYLIKGNGDGTFAAPQVIVEGDTGATDVEIVDLNGDGRMDLVAPSSVTIEEGNGSLSWFEQMEDGSFVEHVIEQALHSTRSDFNEIEVVDVDGDGVLDLISAGSVSTEDGTSYVRVSRGLESLEVNENEESPVTGLTFTADVEGPVVVTLSVDRGGLSAEGGAGVDVSGGGETLTLTGAIDAINAFVAGGNVTFLTDAYDETGAVLTAALDDGAADAVSVDLILTVIPEEDEAPGDIAIDNDSVAENAAVDTVIGTLSAVDPEDQSITFSLIDDASGAFALDGNTLVLSGSVDHEATPTLDIVVRATDVGGEYADQTITINIGNVNEAPTNIALSDDKVVQGSAPGTVIGTLTATDPDAADSFTYTIFEDAGLFEIVGDELRVKDLGEELRAEVTVVATDAGGLSTVKTFNVRVTDDEGNPLGSLGSIVLDASTATSGIDMDAFIRGGFTADVAGGGFPVFDNGTAFEGTEMMIGYGTDPSSKYVLASGALEYYFSTHTVAGTIDTVEFGSLGSGTYDENGAYTGGDVELRITGLTLSNPLPTNSSEEEEIEANGAVHNFALAYMYGSSADQARLDAFADLLNEYSQQIIGSSYDDNLEGTVFSDTIDGGDGNDTLLGGGGNDEITGGGGYDTVDGGDGTDTYIVAGARADFDIYFYASTYIVSKDTSETDALTSVEYIQFDDVVIDTATGEEVSSNTPPTDLALSSGSVAEGSAVGTVVGILSATDDDGDPLTYTLEDDAGGLFELVTEDGETKLVVSGELDYETAASHSVTVKVADGKGGETTEDFTIAVSDVDEGPASALGTITIDASGSDGIDFLAFISGGFLSDAGTFGLPVFDNSTSFSGQEVFFGGSTDADAKYVLARGDLGYFFDSHTVYGEIGTIEYGTRGSGSFNSNGFFVGGDVQLRITGLDFSNPVPTTPEEEAEIEATGLVHVTSTAHMYGSAYDPSRVEDYVAAIYDYAHNFVGSDGDDTYQGSRYGDVVAGNAGNDRLMGNLGNDVIDGGFGDDTAVYTGLSTDYTVTENGDGTFTITDLRAGLENEGTDTLTAVERLEFADGGVSIGEPEEWTTGTSGRDEMVGTSGDDFIQGLGGKDVIKGRKGDDTLDGGNGKDVLKGNKGNDTLLGGNGKDDLRGGRGDDLLKGEDGKDTLRGGNGDDTLIGGPGADKLHGGKGADVFGFVFTTDSLVNARDKILDFDPSEGDLIDLSAIDAGTPDGSFDFIGKSKFDGEAGQLRYTMKTNKTVIRGDVDGDADADFSIVLKNAVALTEHDFIL